MFRRMLAAGALAAALWAGPAYALTEEFVILAQFLNASPGNAPAASVPEAFAAPYGRTLMAVFVSAVRKNADPACLRSKQLDDAAIAARGRDIFVRYGTAALETVLANFDRPKFLKVLAEKTGSANAEEELILLGNDATVKEYLRLERPIQLSGIKNFILKELHRYALMEGLKMDGITWISTGNDEVKNADPLISDEAYERFAEANQAALERFMTLAEAVYEALEEAFDKAKADEWAPRTFFAGVENDLAAICVVKK